MPVILVVVLLGIIEGITEFLPVSSTGHLLIAEHWLPRQTDLFNIVMQTGAVLAVIPLFHRRFHQFIYNWSDPAVRGYFFKIVIAFVITGVPGYLLDKSGFKLPEELAPVAIALLLGGVLFVVVEMLLARRRVGTQAPPADLRQVTWPIVIAVGIGQVIAAAFPGASRSGTTILLSLILGLSRPLATEFSFLVSIPTMLAAGGLKIFQAFHHHAAAAVHEDWTLVIVGTLVAAVVSFVAVRWLLRYVQTHTFIGFGWYRIAVGAALLCLARGLI
ncbi:MAG TPA: undecaprenyl-diphosphate phosphatase [Steroidobacteraceae bacterium]|nr:undecaprenyl-diphosphate phosphatase [Steroidobacteraceae bacterium]